MENRQFLQVDQQIVWHLFAPPASVVTTTSFSFSRKYSYKHTPDWGLGTENPIPDQHEDEAWRYVLPLFTSRSAQKAHRNGFTSRGILSWREYPKWGIITCTDLKETLTVPSHMRKISKNHHEFDGSNGRNDKIPTSSNGFIIIHIEFSEKVYRVFSKRHIEHSTHFFEQVLDLTENAAKIRALFIRKISNKRPSSPFDRKSKLEGGHHYASSINKPWAPVITRTIAYENIMTNEPITA